MTRSKYGFPSVDPSGLRVVDRVPESLHLVHCIRAGCRGEEHQSVEGAARLNNRLVIVYDGAPDSQVSPVLPPHNGSGSAEEGSQTCTCHCRDGSRQRGTAGGLMSSHQNSCRLSVIAHNGLAFVGYIPWRGVRAVARSGSAVVHYAVRAAVGQWFRCSVH